MKGVKGILLMGGEGERFGQDLPKQFHLLGNKPLYLWAYETMLNSALFETLILVTLPSYIEEVEKQVGNHAQVVAGGKSRQESSQKGLIACGKETEIVLIHDAVRPFVTRKILEANIKGAKQFGAVDTCIPSADTLVHSKEGKKIDAIPPREEFLRGQTPQAFSYSLILSAHKQTKRTAASDDCALVLETGKKIHIVEGDETNLKITTPFDLLFAELLAKLLTA